MASALHNALPGTPVPAQRDLQLAAARRPKNVKRGPRDNNGRRHHLPHRRLSLRAKDSVEELRRSGKPAIATGTRPRQGSVDTTTSSGTYTVSNIHQGILYLRPVVRPGNQRNRPSPDPFVFAPQTPPDSASLDSNNLRLPSNDWRQSFSGSHTPTRETSIPPPLGDLNLDHASKSRPPPSPPRPAAHIRSHSFSTVDEHTSQSTEPDTFKVVIERPTFRRPRTADTGSLPILEVPIPHYRLGTPRFSARGTAILRSSLYTRTSATEDFRSSILTPHRATHSFMSSRSRSQVYSPALPPTASNRRTTMDKNILRAPSIPASARVSKAPIGPQLYDALTLNPDDESVVRFSPSGDIVAATPSRLVAHITSPSFLDYELLSDFFLTFRSFLTSRDLTAYLISRLRWAVDRQDDFGRIVRVRTFVALRHWILNYFVDDFVPSYSLRVSFCELVNSLYKDLGARHDGGGGDIKIVGELKKCWRRTCALYWDEADSIGYDSAEANLLPGGRAGSQPSNASIEEIAVLPSTPPRQTGAAKAKLETFGQNPSDQFATRHMDWAQKTRHTPQNSFSSPYIPSQEYEGVQIPLSPASEQSMQVLSCSLPMRGLNKTEPNSDMPLYPHPVPHPVPARFAASPQYSVSVNKPNRPSHAHKRSGSFSDALRDHRAPLSIPKNTAPDATISPVSKLPGSLVRGGLFQPGSPYIDTKKVGNLRHAKSRIELDPGDATGSDTQIRPGYATNPGMKRILGSVRRALSSKQPSTSSPRLASPTRQSQLTPSTRSSNPNLSTTSGGVHKRRYARGRPQVRMDVLSSKVADSFKEAVKEEIRNEEQRKTSISDIAAFDFDFPKKDVTSTQDHKSERDQLKGKSPHDARVHSAVTTGSRSIVIMDATNAPPLPLMSGALPAVEDPSPAPQASVDDERPPHAETSVKNDSQLYDDSLPKDSLDWRRTSRGSVQHSFDQRRSVSESRDMMYSFRRRGSSKPSMSYAGSLRRHVSYNSILIRKQKTTSVATTVLSDTHTTSSDNDPFVLDRPAGPARQLRRRPGGNLRAVDNVHDLEQPQRPHSTGSVSNRTHSVANSVILRSDRYVEPEPSIGVPQDSEPVKKKPISLVDTHSSQPNLRPSFEAEVAKLAALPDDVDDDGGIEAALMKLEGRYEKKSPDSSPRETVALEGDGPTGAAVDSSNPSYITSEPNSSHTRNHSKADDVLHRPLAPPEAEGQGMYRLSAENFNRRNNGTSAVESEDSYSSIPLLDRGLSEITTSPRSHANESSFRASAQVAPLNTKDSTTRLRNQAARQVASPSSSAEYVVETESMKRIPRDGTLPRSSAARESFLLDEDQDLSDESNGLAKSDDTSHGVRSFFDDEPATMDNEKDILPTHPMRHPPTPPLTANRLNDLPENSLPPVDTTVFQRGLPTPGLTPTSRLNNQPFGQGQLNQPVETAIELQDLKKVNSPPPPTHMPFILAYDSEMLAQQFTMVEKDALDEIDWKELIELRWKQSSPQIRDWVQYLRTQEARGVDVVIARFNLVVKWAVSEILLTETIQERARCIVKYIHIAAHTRRLRNYATMYQITIALLSADVSRLKRTWALVPAAELQTMRDLEGLVQPLRNFHNLRVEMETSSVEEGCIPFIGIYTRDLIYNAQKPAFIESPPTDGERLVNFERHHTAAMIVKNLLRLLEASSKYTFKAEPTIISKCLWMAALSDEELMVLSRKHE